MSEVSEWGVGRPDYYTPVISSRPQILTDIQTKWAQSATYTVSAQAVSINSFYTVPEGYILEIGGGFISCRDSCINRLRIVANSEELVGDFRFDIQGAISFSPSAGQTVLAGTEIVIYIYNNDILTSEFSLTLSGVLMRT